MTKEDDIINSATSKRIRNQNLFNFANDMCTAFATEYNDSTAARYYKLDYLNKAKNNGLVPWSVREHLFNFSYVIEDDVELNKSLKIRAPESLSGFLLRLIF